MSAIIDVYKDWLGIPEGPRPPDHYQLLRLVEFEDDVEKIRKHYKKLNAHVRKYATGQYSLESQELLNELAKAMLCLTDEARKRDYDRGLGREIEEEAGARRKLGRVLEDEGTLSAEQVQEAEDYAERTGLSLRDALVQMKLIDPETAARALAEELGRPYVDLADLLPDDTVLDQVPRNVVKRNSCLPLFVDDDSVLVACVDDPDNELQDEFRLRFGIPMRPVIATPLAINQGIAKYYAPGARQEAEEQAPAKKKSGVTSIIKTPKKKKSQLTDTERAERKQLGIIFMCWTVIGLSLLDVFVLIPNLWSRFLPDWLPITTLLVGPFVLWGLYSNYIKQ